MSAPVVIAVEGLGKRYRLGSDAASYGLLTESLVSAGRGIARRIRHGAPPAAPAEIWALRDVSFSVTRGEIVGVVGRNGAGKTTLLKVLSRITDPTEGRAELRGRVGSLLEVGTGFHPELSGRENIFLNGAILGMTGKETRAKFDEIVEFAELARFIDTPVKRYSSGMYVRLAFAVAAFLEPEILFVDEVLSVGDQAFQRRCLGRMGEIAHSGRTIFFVSHNLASVSALCSRALLIDQGRLSLDGSVDEVLQHYLASLQVLSSESLAHREDRQGDGRLRLVHASVEGPEGSVPRTGAEAVISFDYESDQVTQPVAISIAIEGAFGDPVFHCSSRVTGDILNVRRDRGALRCRVPSLPLLPGRYSVSVYAEINGVVADWVRNAVDFDVVESDLFGTGHLPPTTHGRIVVDHSWESLAAP
jgi:lipopolysaccharide transport system ATP-binding protein